MTATTRTEDAMTKTEALRTLRLAQASADAAEALRLAAIGACIDAGATHDEMLDACREARA